MVNEWQMKVCNFMQLLMQTIVAVYSLHEHLKRHDLRYTEISRNLGPPRVSRLNAVLYDRELPAILRVFITAFIPDLLIHAGAGTSCATKPRVGRALDMNSSLASCAGSCREWILLILSRHLLRALFHC